jgi:tripartite-type tricarboxylate transporter receptor subunit TctC
MELAAAVVATPVNCHRASALDYPTRLVRLIVGVPPGGVTDLYARLVGQWLSERLGQPFIVDNRPGASSNLAVEAVVKAPPDGYTLLVFGSNNAQHDFV